MNFIAPHKTHTLRPSSRDLDPSGPIVTWLWSILETDFTEEERTAFLVFVSGRSRLPANPADLPSRFTILRVDRPADGLPSAQTCFFQLRLPPYSTREVMLARMRYAVRHCRSIDMDHYMLNREQDP